MVTPRSHFPTILGSGAPICSATSSCVQLRCSRSYFNSSFGRASAAISSHPLYLSAPTQYHIVNAVDEKEKMSYPINNIKILAPYMTCKKRFLQYILDVAHHPMSIG